MAKRVELFGKMDNEIVALWNWNGALEENRIMEQCEALFTTGVDCVAIRPQADMNPTVLSQEFAACFKRVLAIAHTHNRSVRFADDLTNSSESSFYAEIRETPSFRSVRLYLDEIVDLSFGEKYRFVPQKSIDKCYIVALPYMRSKVRIDKAMVLYDGESGVDEVVWAAPCDVWRVCRFVVRFEENHVGAYLPNVFNVKIAQHYCTTVLAKIGEITQEFPSSVFRGMIHETPAIEISRNGIPWDDDVFISKYRSRFKKNLIETLPALFMPVDDEEAKYRPHIYNFLHDTLYERFPQVVHRWCSQQEIPLWLLGSAGHQHTTETSSGMGIIPAIGQVATGITICDMGAFTEVPYITQADANRSREIRTFGIVGRNTTMKSDSIGELKTQIDWLILNGADDILIDGFWLNATYHFEKTTPLGLSFSHPDFPNLPQLISSTRTVLAVHAQQNITTNGVIILSSMQSALADFTVESPKSIERAFRVFSQTISDLHALQIPYIVLTEMQILDTKIVAGGFLETSNGARYCALILPYSRLVNNSLFVYVERFAISKGIVLFADGIPVGSFDDGQNSSFTSRVEKIFASKSKLAYVGRVQDIASVFLQKMTDRSSVIQVDGGQAEYVLIRRYLSDGVTFLSLLNRGVEGVALQIPHANEKMYVVDQLTGTLRLAEVMQENAAFHLYLYPNELLMLCSGRDLSSKENVLIDGASSDFLIRIPENKWHFSPCSLNRFPLSRWNARMGVHRATHHLSYSYETTFEVVTPPKEMYLTFYDAIPRKSRRLENRFRVAVNGVFLPLAMSDPELGYQEDSALLSYQIPSDILGVGVNRVLVHSNGDDDLPVPTFYPPFVHLSAPVEQGKSGWKILVNADEVNGESYPYFQGIGEYSCSFEVPKCSARVVLVFEKMSGTAHICLNGSDVGTLYYPPYRMDITPYLNSTRNDLTVQMCHGLTAQNRLEAGTPSVIGSVHLHIFDGD